MQIQWSDGERLGEGNPASAVPRTRIVLPKKLSPLVSSPPEFPIVSTDTGVERGRELLQFAPGRAKGGRDSAEQPHSRPPGFALEIRRVLTVDDSPEFLKAVRRHFKRMGVLERFIFDASNSEGALRLARSKAPDLALIDLVLELGDPQSGLDLIAALHREHPHLVIGAVSGRMTDERAAASKAAGAKWCLEKPFSAELLAGTIALNEPPVPEILRVDRPFHTMKRVFVERVVDANGGSKSAASRVLEVPRSSVQRISKPSGKRKR